MARQQQNQEERLTEVLRANEALLQSAAGKKKHGKVFFKSAFKREEFLHQGRTIVERFNVGQRIDECPDCRARHYRDPKSPKNSFFKCCKSGAIKYALPQCPDFLQKLYRGEHPRSANFLAHIRNYNAALSLGCTGYKKADQPTHGIYCFRIQGGINYMLYDLNPAVPSPVYNQTWILDAKEATDARMANPANAKVDAKLLESLHKWLAEHNPLCRKYKFVYDTAIARGQDFKIVFRNTTERQYDPVTGDFIAAVYGDNETDDTERGVMCFVKTGADQPAPLITNIEPAAGASEDDQMVGFLHFDFLSTSDFFNFAFLGCFQ